jgi:hypothetical protein
MKDQEHNNEAEHRTRDETQQHDATELLRLQGQVEKPPKTNFLTLFSVYLLLVGTVIAAGSFAYYSGHKTSQEILFYLSIALLSLIPFILLSYLFLTFSIHKKLSDLLDRVMDSPFGRFIVDHLNVVFYTSYAIAFWEIGYAIRRFPTHPRLSLTLIASYLLNIIYLAHVSSEIKMIRRNIEMRQRLNRIGRVLLHLAKKDPDLKDY